MVARAVTLPRAVIENRWSYPIVEAIFGETHKDGLLFDLGQDGVINIGYNESHRLLALRCHHFLCRHTSKTNLAVPSMSVILSTRPGMLLPPRPILLQSI